MTPAETQALSPDFSALPQYDGFPYLNTRVSPSLFHITLLPADAPEPTLLNIARRQVAANRLPACLVLAANRGVYFGDDGRAHLSDSTPRGGTLLANLLESPVDFLPTADLRARQTALIQIVENCREKGRYITGDLSKGGRTATPEEARRLEGKDRLGVPRGLTQCPACREWRGNCLDPSPQFAGLIMRVHCRCENHNRCARCGLQLYTARLNANFYDVQDGMIRHVPGYCGLGHKCGTSSNRPLSASSTRADDAAGRIGAPVRRELYAQETDAGETVSLFCDQCGSVRDGTFRCVIFDVRGYACSACGRPLDQRIQ
jgi:hypothetical protein